MLFLKVLGMSLLKFDIFPFLELSSDFFLLVPNFFQHFFFLVLHDKTQLYFVFIFFCYYI